MQPMPYFFFYNFSILWLLPSAVMLAKKSFVFFIKVKEDQDLTPGVWRSSDKHICLWLQRYSVQFLFGKSNLDDSSCSIDISCSKVHVHVCISLDKNVNWQSFLQVEPLLSKKSHFINTWLLCRLLSFRCGVDIACMS